MPISALTQSELVRLYGPWAGRTPAEAGALFAGYPGPWWVAGGWALEAFTGVRRPHGDIDLELPRIDLALLRRHLAGRLDVWTAESGALRPLLPDDDPDAPADTVLPPDCGQVWVRAGGAEPWEYDIQLMPGDRERWVFKRDPRITRPLVQVISTVDGLPFLRSEVQLLLKAKGRRDKDQADFDAALPLLAREAAEWLADSLDIAHPGHPWSTAVRARG